MCGDGSADGGVGQGKVDEEVEVPPVGAVAGLGGGEGEPAFDEFEVEPGEEGAVEEQGGPFPALGVAGELAAVPCEVGVTEDGDIAGEERCEGIALARHDGLVGTGDRGELRSGVDGEADGVVQATRALDDGSAAAASAEDGYSFGAASVEAGFAGAGLAIADDDPVGGSGPEPQGGGDFLGFECVEHGFIPGEEFVGREPGWQFERMHAAGKGGIAVRIQD